MESQLLIRTGKTTRLIDSAIQYLFKNKQLYLFRKQGISKAKRIIPPGENLFIDPDHSSSNMAQQDFVYRFLRRLEIEHRNSCKIDMQNRDYIHIKIK